MRRIHWVPILRPFLLVVLGSAVLAGCTSGGDGVAADRADDAGAPLTFAGDVGLLHHTDDGRVVLHLRTGPEVAMAPATSGDADEASPVRPQDLVGRWAETENDMGAPDAVVTLRAAEVAFELDDAELEAHDEGSVWVSGEPVGEPPPATFDDWSLSVVPEDEGAVAVPAARDLGGPVLDREDDEVASALRAAPPTPSILGVGLAGEPEPPSRFVADLEVLLPSDGRYEVDVNTPGVADARPLVVVAEASAGGARLVDADPAEAVRLVDQQPEGEGVRVTVAAGPFDIGSVTRVSAQVRRLEGEGVERRWETELGCVPPGGEVRWRGSGTDEVKAAPCPDPYGWVVSVPVLPSLRPDPASVVAAAGFDEPAPLVTRIERLAAVTGAGPESTVPRRIRISVQAEFDIVRDAPGVPPVTVPVVLIDADAGDLDPGAVAAAIEAWVDRSGVDVARLRLDVTVSSTDPLATLLVVRGVELPWG
ncbi:hypothetical protein [Rhabdothermincola salaria]|uniref:hypothetical protein n=1 Tax=Rhabdothermincola salaria TaxID=2903142 RepID=UPI001E3C20A7|nr:hypothetical protein [Rhabdothermincola salaria]MCD9624749.1 hypothetical protein [Rhabdothermincola salaria]